MGLHEIAAGSSPNQRTGRDSLQPAYRGCARTPEECCEWNSCKMHGEWLFHKLFYPVDAVLAAVSRYWVMFVASDGRITRENTGHAFVAAH